MLLLRFYLKCGSTLRAKERNRMLITTTDGFKALELDSRGRNQGPNEKLLKDIDLR